MIQMKNNQQKLFRSRFPALGLVLALLAGMGCAQEIVDINRVQPNYVDKSTFTGEWYHRAVVVDKQFSSGYPFVGYQGDMERIVWEITRDALLVFRSYSKAPGAEGGDAGSQTLIASFPIQKHFDIRREYNPANGRESNVVSENDFDNPWWERQYMRVDWSNNTVQDYDLNGWVRFYMGSEGTTTRNAENDTTNPWRVRLSNDYIETTVEANMAMTPRACNATGDWYVTCSTNLAPSTRYKLSFMRIDPKDDYEPLLYPDYQSIRYGLRTTATGETEFCYEDEEGCEARDLWLYYNPFGDYEICDPTRHDVDECFQETTRIHSRFGYFRTERFLYDRENGTTLSAREQLANRWNIWEKSFDEDGEPIPYADRTIKPIVYHLNVMFPEDLHPEIRSIEADWNGAFVNLLDALGVETDENTEVFKIVENSCSLKSVKDFADKHDLNGELESAGIYPVAYGNLERACAVLEYHTAGTDHAFTWEQLGDLRYSFLNWTHKAEQSSPLGYGPSSADPLTGQIVSANANVYGTVVNRYAAWAADIVELINGEIDENDILNGTNAREHIENARQRWHKKLSPEKLAQFKDLFHQRTEHLSDEQYLVERPLHAVNENMHLLKDLGFDEELLMTEDVLRMMAGPELYQPGQDINDEAWERARPSNWGRAMVPDDAYRQGSGHLGDPEEGHAHSHTGGIHAFAQKEDFLGRQNFCFLEEMVEPAIADLALSLQGKSREEVYNAVRKSVFQGVMAHEIGHTVGLRHNFEGSADPLNFFSQFWDVNTADKYQSRITESSHEQRYSSIMDYHQRFNSDFGGIGLYDKAAIAFGYGQMMEVFDERAGSFVPTQFYNNLGLFDYDDLPYLFEGAANDPVYNEYRAAYDAYWGGDRTASINIKDLGLNPTQGKTNMYQRRMVPWTDQVKHITYREIASSLGLGSTTFENSTSALQWEVPYQYCTDQFAWGGNLTCNRWDMGATSSEIVSNAAEMYDAYYIFNNFRRDRIMSPYWASSYINRLYQRTYQPMLNAFRYYYYYQRSSSRIWPMVQDWAGATFSGLDFFTTVLAAPEPGTYCLSDGAYVPEAEVGSCDDSVNIPLGMGRHFTTTWTDEFFYRPEVIGQVWDKVLAIMAMTDSAAFFTKDFSSSFNRGAFSIGYYRVFGPELTEYFTSFMKGEPLGYSGHLYVNDGVPTLTPPSLVQLGEDAAPIDAPKIKASTSWGLRYYGTLYPLIRYSSTVDAQLDFGKRSRIAYLGGAQDPTVSDDVEVGQALFTHPITLVQYTAYSVDGDENSPGYQLLQEANALVSDGGAWHMANAAYEAALADYEASASEANETALDQAEAALDVQTGLLQEKVHIIDMVRSLSEALEYSN